MKNLNLDFQHLSAKMTEENKLEMLTIKEAAKRFRASEGLIRKLVREGSLPVIRVGETKHGKMFIKSDALRKYLYGEAENNNS